MKDRRTRALSLDSNKLTESTTLTEVQPSKTSSTSLALMAYSASSESSDGSPRELSPISEEHRRKLSGSPRRSILVSSKGGSPRSGSGNNKNSSPRSNNSSPRSNHKPSSSPRITILSQPALEQIDSSPLPIDRQDASMIIWAAHERFADATNAGKVFKEHEKRKEKIKEEEAKAQADKNKQRGHIYHHLTRTEQGNPKKYTVMVTGNIGYGSMVFLMDPSIKLGDGARGEIQVVYNLEHEKKCALKIFNKDSEDIKSIFKEINNLAILQRFIGYCVGQIDQDKDETRHCVVMRLEPGKSLVEYLYLTDADLKSVKNYKDDPNYYAAKKYLSYAKRFTLAISAIGALAEIHQAQLVHRDISCDNLLVDESGSGYRTCFIDLDAAISLSCDLITLPYMPQNDSLYSLPFLSNAAYVRYEQRLFYVNKHTKECTDLNVSEVTLNIFDDTLLPSGKARTLTQDELLKIDNLISHSHIAPRLTKLSNAYGCAPPEFSQTLTPRENKAYATFLSDVYSLGVVLVDIFSNVNLQKLLREDYQQMMTRTGSFREELPASTLKMMAKDLFAQEDVVISYSLSRQEKMEKIIFQNLVLPELQHMLNGALAEDPAKRLQASNLKEFATRLTMLHELLESVELICKGIGGLQKAGISLDAVLRVIKNFTPQSVDSLLSEEKSLPAFSLFSPDFEGMEKLIDHQQALEKARQERREMVYGQLKSLINGCRRLKNPESISAKLQLVIEELCLDGKQAFDFFMKLIALEPKQEKQAYYKNC